MTWEVSTSSGVCGRSTSENMKIEKNDTEGKTSLLASTSNITYEHLEHLNFAGNVGCLMNF